MKYSTYGSLPRWGRVGVAARGLRHSAALQVPSAAIPSFPHKGMAQEKGVQP